MHVRWRGLELPAMVTVDPKTRTPTFARFIAEPFERGFGTTIGNSLRRILLSSLEGAAVTKINRIQVTRGKDETIQATHEFTSLPGVLEDITDIVLNVKGLVVGCDSDEPKMVRLAASHEGPDGEAVVTADLFEADASVTIANPDHVIATLTEPGTQFLMDLTVARGRGYAPASDQFDTAEDQIIGEIPVDSIYSPVQRVRYRVEDTRVGQRTNYDKLILDVWTDGTTTPEMAVVEAAKILRKHLNPFVQYFELGTTRVSAEASRTATIDQELIRKLDMTIADLDLSVRASNCIESAQIRTVGDLVQKSQEELLGVRSFGKTSLREVARKLEDLGLSLGMALPEGYGTANPASVE